MTRRTLSMTGGIAMQEAPTNPARRKSPYDRLIRESMARVGRIGAADPRHVEAFIRLERGTIYDLHPHQLDTEVALALACIRQGGTDEAEQLAQSYGL